MSMSRRQMGWNMIGRLRHMAVASAVVAAGSMMSWSSSCAQELSSGIDQSNFNPGVSIGEDFYLHVNGLWLERTEIPADKSN